MKKLISFTGLALFGMLVIFLFCRVDCRDKTKDSPSESDLCGDQKVEVLTFWNENFNPPLYYLPLKPEEHFTVQGDGWAYYDYCPDQSYENVCPHKHIKGTMRIEINEGFTDKVKYNAEVAYGILFTYQIPTWVFSTPTTGPSLADVSFEIGIKNVYGDSPGWFFPVITLAVEYQGDDNLTHQFFMQAIKSVYIKSDYNEWKDNSGASD